MNKEKEEQKSRIAIEELVSKVVSASPKRSIVLKVGRCVPKTTNSNLGILLKDFDL